jgi:hypothetical protein
MLLSTFGITGEHMHPYAIDSEEKRYILFGLAILSIFAARGLSIALEWAGLNPPWWIDMPSVLSFYGLFCGTFDRWFWKLSALRKISLVKTPNLGGTWKGFGASSFDKHATTYQGMLKIRQTWTRISIILETDTSVSRSGVAGIMTHDTAAPFLSYEYLNEPKANAKDKMHSHRGTARLSLKKSENMELLEGEYYTGRDRQHFGSMRFQRTED